MESYRLSSKLVEENKEYIIQTSSDARVNSVLSSVFINGEIAETNHAPHPIEFTPEEVLDLVKNKHKEKKLELEVMVKSYHVAVEGGDPQYMYHLGTAFFYKGYYQEARELFSAALVIKPDFHQPTNYLGITELILGNVDVAVEVAQRAVNLRPSFADYRYNLGCAFMASKSCGKAISEFEEAIRINMYYGDAYFGKGLTLLVNALEQKDTELFTSLVSKTIDTMKRAALIDSAFETDVFSEALRALDEGDLQVAYVLFDKVIQTRTDKRNKELSSYYMKYVYLHDGLSDTMITNRIDFLEGELKKNPTYADLHVELAQCYINRSSRAWHLSIDHFRRALEINPSLTEIENRLVKAEVLYEQIQPYTNWTEDN